ncbi:2-amino-4-hydroxy-6-hydroxymethyldihydropteridinediphosphokinase [soil metagenome]
MAIFSLSEDVLAIGLGGNVGGEPAVRARFAAARDAFAEIGSVRSAPLYRSAPIGPAQPAFLNTVIKVVADGAQPEEVIALIRELEALLGRDRANEVRWGPRTIDLDVLVWGARVLRTPDLEVPHPRLAERKFVIAPMIELFGEALVIEGRSLGELARGVAQQDVELITSSW